MSNRKKIASVAFTGAAVAAMAGMHAATALATSGTWHISPTADQGAYGATNTSAAATLHTGTATLTCSVGTATASGSLSGNGRTGTPVKLGTIAAANFGTLAQSCAVDGIGFSAHLNKPVNLSGVSYNAATGVTTGRITGSISATLTGSISTCKATVKGTSISGTFTNSTHVLNINPNHKSTLSITSAGGKTSAGATACLGTLKVGNKAYFAAKYQVNPPKSKVTITDP